MSTLAGSLLDAWERGHERSAIERALLLVALTEPHEPCARLARMSIGERDSRLLTLREQTFGRRMGSRLTCPSCTTELEFEFTTDDARARGVPAAEHWTLRHEGYEVSLRLPDSTDLAALSPDDDHTTNVKRLLGRCVVTACHDGKETSVEALPPEVAGRVSARLSEIDPQADVQIEAACPACAHHWHALLDIASYVWAEIHAWACRTLRDVHAIAATYGWSEAEIMALSPVRRQIYLDLIQS